MTTHRKGQDSRRLRSLLALAVLVYGLAGAASQKLIPGVDEIFPFFGWSLFSWVPNRVERYTLLIHRHDGRAFDPPVSLEEAPPEMVAGNRSLARKLVARLGKRIERGAHRRARPLRRTLEGTYLRGEMRYELVAESYDPLERWRTGAIAERRSLAELSRRGTR